MTKAVQSLALATTLTLFGAAVADAAAVRAGDTTIAIANLSRGSAVAYDSANHVYLVVSTFGMLRGRFVDRDGHPIGASFVIQSSGNYTHFPAVRFSPDADGGSGGFLVAWHESDVPIATSVHARIVSYRVGGPASADTLLAPEGSFWEQAPAVAYSTASHEFLVAFTRFDWGIRALRVDNNAAAKGPVFTVTRTGQFEGYPSASYSPASDRFAVVWKGFNDPSLTGFVEARLVQAGTNDLVGASATRVGAGGGTYITDVAYQSGTNQFLVAWYRDAGGTAKTTLGRLVNSDLSPAGNIVALSSLWKAYDALGVAFNPVSNTFFMISHDGRGLLTSIENGGVELDSSGTPVDNGFLVTAGAGKSNFYPRIAGSTEQAAWLVSTAYGFESTKVQIVSGTAGGGGGGTVTPPPAPAAAQPMMSIDLPGSPVVQQPFLMTGWGLDRGAGSGGGADVIHVWAWPTTGGAPIFAGVALINVARPDLANVFGPQFGTSGWSLTINNLPPGSYQLAAYLHSTVTNSFSLAKLVPVAIADTLMSVDTPVSNATVPRSGFWLGGWAIDRGAPAGPGVDTLHVWAFPVSGGAAQFAGVASYGMARPDLGAAFGPRFMNSGYSLFINTLGPGTYDLVVFSHSTVTGTFTTWRIVRVNVQ
jgi:hypothetical protein